MRETKSGRGPLCGVGPAQGRFEVDFKIHFDTQIRVIRSGMPPVAKVTATVSVMQSTDGRFIPAGQYDLDADGESIRLQNLGSSWHVLSKP
ncbi:MAG TPA: hypothetical protein VEU11_00040 [Terriglobales bacterium]|nr:hypothetical protein [Terriglobales bacterium]